MKTYPAEQGHFFLAWLGGSEQSGTVSNVKKIGCDDPTEKLTSMKGNVLVCIS